MKFTVCTLVLQVPDLRGVTIIPEGDQMEVRLEQVLAGAEMEVDFTTHGVLGNDQKVYTVGSVVPEGTVLCVVPDDLNPVVDAAINAAKTKAAEAVPATVDPETTAAASTSAGDAAPAETTESERLEVGHEKV